MIGPNGAGKTTFFNVMTGLYSATRKFPARWPAYRPTAVHRVAWAGIARTFQNIRLFNAMSAGERHGRAPCAHPQRPLAALSRHRRAREEEARTREQACRLLEYVGLAGFADYRADSLSYGHQRRLEIARALATEPLLLALDDRRRG
ncbi:ATP-binding cassette domain-containing protein [Pseudomonas chlororaphis]|uniref:ATP-binding cassette domain-containing protein n=1 Tax=Pseudomonas chlororaphis TaxID=587753 RepID=UPI0024084C07|nr:ATP-binding cassette domain-containing protein [Pseudomonas chlororaphis]